MAKKALMTIQFMLFWIYSFALTPILQSVVEITDVRRPPEVVFYIFTSMLFIPEVCLILFPSFRNWIRQGIEDADGELNKNDVKDLLVFYFSIWCIRAYVLAFLLTMFYEVDIPFDFKAMSFFGGLGSAGMVVLKNLYGGVKNK